MLAKNERKVGPPGKIGLAQTSISPFSPLSTTRSSTPSVDGAKAFDGPAFALLSPGAPYGSSPVSLEDRDHGPQSQLHEPFVIVDGLYRSEAAARKAAESGIQKQGKLRRLLVQLDLRGAVVIDARGQLNAMALRRGDARQLDELAALYERDADLVRISGPEGEQVLVFTEAIGKSLLIEDEAIVTAEAKAPELRRHGWLAAAFAIPAAGIWELLKLTIGPFLVLAVPVWLVILLVFAVLLVPRAIHAVRKFVERTRNLMHRFERVVDVLETDQAQGQLKKFKAPR